MKLHVLGYVSTKHISQHTSPSSNPKQKHLVFQVDVEWNNGSYAADAVFHSG